MSSTIPVSMIGIRFAMAVKPFWKPDQYSALKAVSSMANTHIDT